MATKTEQSALEIKEIILETVTLRIVGETPLIITHGVKRQSVKSSTSR